MRISDLSLVEELAYSTQLALGVVFALAAAPKLRRPRRFARTVAEYRLLPRRAVPAVACAVVAKESFLAVTFLSGRLLAVALAGAAAILLVFVGAVAVSLRRGQRNACGCFGAADERVSARSPIRLLALLAGVAFVAAVGQVQVAPTTLGHAGVDGLGLAVAAGGTAGFLLLAGAWLLSLPEVVAVLRPQRARSARS